MSRELDIVLFGATGFTGYRAIPILNKLVKEKNRNLKFGIAGRSEKKLKQILSEWESKLGCSLSHVPIITADVSNQQSLNLMVRQARIVINCVGPFILYGEPVVRACIDESTHYVDITGEPSFIEKMAVKYHQAAESKHLYIISACGLDCIPTDLGVVFLQQNFKGIVNSVELFIKIWEEGRPISGPLANTGTWNSAIYTASDWNFKTLLRLLTARRPDDLRSPKVSQKLLPHTDPIEDGWILPFPGSDGKIIERSQQFLYKNNQERPAQTSVYFVAQTTKFFIGLIISAIALVILAQVAFGRRLLQNYAHLFTFGMFSANESPSDAKTNNTWSSVTIRGKGWKNKLENPDAQYTTPPNRTVVAQVKGQNPAYGFTNYCLVLCAIKILTEPSKLPKKGGVYPPGFVFAKTSLIEELHENGVTFEIISEIDT